MGDLEPARTESPWGKTSFSLFAEEEGFSSALDSSFACCSFSAFSFAFSASKNRILAIMSSSVARSSSNISGVEQNGHIRSPSANASSMQLRHALLLQQGVATGSTISFLSSGHNRPRSSISLLAASAFAACVFEAVALAWKAFHDFSSFRTRTKWPSASRKTVVSSSSTSLLSTYDQS